MTKRPLSVTLTLYFILLNVLVWLVFGVIVAADLHPGLPDLPYIRWIMAFLSFAGAGVLVGLYLFLGKRSRIAYFLTLAFLIAISLLTIFDDFGWIDFVVLVVNVIPIILLIKDRAWYLSGKPALVKSQ